MMTVNKLVYTNLITNIALLSLLALVLAITNWLLFVRIRMNLWHMLSVDSKPF